MLPCVTIGLKYGGLPRVVVWYHRRCAKTLWFGQISAGVTPDGQQSPPERVSRLVMANMMLMMMHTSATIFPMPRNMIFPLA